MTSAAATVRYGIRPTAGPKSWRAVREFGPLEWATAAVVLQTILFNPVVESVGPLNAYLNSLTWPLLFGAALVRVAWSTDRALRRAVGAVVVGAALIFGLIAVQLAVTGLQVYSVNSLAKLAYLPAGAVVALSVYRAADTLLDLAVVALGVKCTLLLSELVQGPIDLLHRLNPASLGGANTFAMFIGIVTTLRLSTWFLGRRRPGPLVVVSLLPCVLAMALTFTRSAFVAFGAGLLCILLVSPLRQGARAGMLSATMAVVLLAVLLMLAPVRDRIASAAQGSLSGREQVADAAWQGINQRPLAGHGFGSFQFKGAFIVEFSGAGANTTPSTHNMVLQVWYEGGLLGLIAVSWVIWLTIRRCWSPILVPVLLVLLVDGMFETFPYVVQTSWVLGIMLAVGLSYRQAARPGDLGTSG